MLKVTHPRYEDLILLEKDGASDNGHGKEYASYIQVTHGGETICLESDAMEPEDCSFHRDLSWISDIISKAYELGKQDAQQENSKNNLLSEAKNDCGLVYK